tara:strand:+ start:431 stop:1090 length:660 start_codon:yes stop_codon:yes gene_type:complete
VEKIFKRLKEKQNNEYLLFNSVPIIVKNRLTNDIKIVDLIKSIENTLPYSFRGLIKSITILDHPIFKERNINALFKDKKIFISNHQDDLNDLLDDIIHEFAHALEREFKKEIYSDKSIRNEFLSKRNQLETILRTSGYDTLGHDFEKKDYDQIFDDFLLNTVGYETFRNLTNHSLFINPYAATSLREYFATGFEEYILGDHKELQVVSPKLYKKLQDII